jgi:hypothetical protein
VEANDRKTHFGHSGIPVILIVSGWPRYLAWILCVGSLACSALYLVPLRYGPAVAALITCCLCANAYVAGQALFQVTLPRYSDMICPLVPLLAAVVLIWAAGKLSRPASVARHYARSTIAGIGSSKRSPAASPGA